MDKATINGADIAYEVQGEGEPVLFIHGAFIADALRPLADHPSLADVQRIVYHRRGYGESTGEVGADVPAHANDALALLDHVGIDAAHVVGHSYGGATAVQLAATAPARVRSLALLEPAVMAIPSGETLGEVMPKIIGPFMEGDADEALDRFFRTIAGRDYRRIVDTGVSESAWTQVRADADDAFAGDLGTLGGWSFGPEQAASIRCPVLFVLGEASVEANREVFAEFGATNPDVDMFREMIGVFQTWLPQGELVALPGLNHALQMQDKDAVAGVVAPFLARERSAAAT
jgi:pimeloyl-ACP methyl ester carboxylesterase